MMIQSLYLKSADSLKKTADIVHAGWSIRQRTNVCVKNFVSKLKTRIFPVSVTVGCMSKLPEACKGESPT